MRTMLGVAVVLAVCTTGSVCFAGGAISVHEPWVREAPPSAPMAGYLELRNDSGQLRMLVRASADGFGNTMIHRTEYSEGRASMVHVDQVEIPPNGRVRFEPGGLHIMLMQPQRRRLAGDLVMIKLQFDDGTTLDTAFPVRKAQGRPEGSGHGGHGQS